eukprot:1528468-Rhodomonas_salina.1
MADYCSPRDKGASPVTGYSAFEIRKRMYPWVATGMTDDIVVSNYQRLRQSMQIIENVWRRVGLWEHVLEPFPE